MRRLTLPLSSALGVSMSYRSILISTLYFALLLIASTFVAEPLMAKNNTLFYIAMSFVWLSPGYVAASIAKKHVVMHASMSGLCCFIIAVALTYIFNIGGFTAQLGYKWLAASVICFGIGALIWQLKHWVTNENT